MKVSLHLLYAGAALFALNVSSSDDINTEDIVYIEDIEEFSVVAR